MIDELLIVEFQVIDFPATTGKSKADILNWLKKTALQPS